MKIKKVLSWTTGLKLNTVGDHHNLTFKPSVFSGQYFKDLLPASVSWGGGKKKKKKGVSKMSWHWHDDCQETVFVSLYQKRCCSCSEDEVVLLSAILFPNLRFIVRAVKLEIHKLSAFNVSVWNIANIYRILQKTNICNVLWPYQN